MARLQERPRASPNVGACSGFSHGAKQDNRARVVVRVEVNRRTDAEECEG